MLRITFHGVGDGDCIVIEFPDSTMGVVDSCSRPGSSLSPAVELVRGKKLAFCCMTHPHADHYRGLREVLESADTSGWNTPLFWHTLADLDKVASDLFCVVDFDGKDPATLSQEKADLGYLVGLFKWMISTYGSGFAESIRQVTHRNIAGVSLVLSAPSTTAWAAYFDDIKNRRKERRPLRYRLANDISLGMMLEYGGTRVWLLGDLSSREQLSLPSRVRAATPAGVQYDARARILKVAHHGAKNSWDPTLAQTLTICDQTDVIIFSANGSDHPDRSVFSRWLETRKQVVGTWEPKAPLLHAPTADWFEDSITMIAPLCEPKPPRDVVISIEPNGAHSVVFKSVPKSTP